MDEKLYRPEPIPRRSQQTPANQADRKRSAPRTPMNGSRPDAREVIARILEDERFRDAARSAAAKAHAVPGGTQASGFAVSDSMSAGPRPQPAPVTGSGRIAGALDSIFDTLPSLASATNRSSSEGASPAANLFSAGASQPAFDLPDRYREMRAISRWQEGADGRPGRWLTEAELFYRQGTFMADWEDSCPYKGLFKSYFPTYNAMSDRQLRGYFTWRAAVRRGDVQETSLSFAYVYLYELINGIGVADPLDGFRKIEAFWQAYRDFAPELDRYANVWLQDYAVYHGLDPELLASRKTVAFDRALIALRDADAEMERGTRRMPSGAAMGASGALGMMTGAGERGGVEAASDAAAPVPRRRKRNEPTIPLPPDTAREERLFDAIDALSTYRLSNSRLFKEHPDALRHVACAVYVRMSEHHRKQRKNSLLESWFGEEVVLPYTMFGSAVFFEPARHPDAIYELDEIHHYRCERGLWTCERFHGSRARSPKLGTAMRAVDRSLRETCDPDHPLKGDDKMPKYLQKFIDQEIEAWRSWSAAHAPVHIDIDLSRLAGIRSAAAETREALLIDEERDEEYAASSMTAGEKSSAATDQAGRIQSIDPLFSKDAKFSLLFGTKTGGQTDDFCPKQQGEPKDAATSPPPGAKTEEIALGVHAATVSEPAKPSQLSPVQAQYVRALLAGSHSDASAAVHQAKTTEDLLVDAINEALFDQIGDTVIEYGPDGAPQLIEDYLEDVERISEP